MLKPYSSLLVANDLEKYSEVINKTFLRNRSEFNSAVYENERRGIDALLESGYTRPGIITEHYAPADTENIQLGERAFYTHENALRIDTIRAYIDTIADRDTAQAMLLTEASIHVNTSGVFKGFYKDRKTGIGMFGGTGRNALSRIMAPVVINEPLLSAYECQYSVLCGDAKDVFTSGKVKDADITYIDPPYNQHPYGSNYFMLNVILENRLPSQISKVSGIPTDWNRSAFNGRRSAHGAFAELLTTVDSKYIVVSYNNEGFMSLEEICSAIADNYGQVQEVENIAYSAFKGSRNLRGRSAHTNEYLIMASR